ncbi:MFS transporter [Nocardioides nitrophenolicus]|uniref:MFS transporter n=1 Tax=Nocardioides nitrophenolicus TaxID=60489 RepID=UPI00195865D0|nr:MFS transporter [Nocardioides nitrophenolicus]MBM7518481.1 putative MFS family arabinose efflux permease [Nocardioides nitrophenolicus]
MVPESVRRTAASTGPGAALRVRTFRLLIAVQLVNAIAVWVHVVGVQWLLTERGEAAVVVSLAPAAMSLPFIALALPVGVVVSHARRQRLIGGAVALSGIASVAASLLVLSGADRAAPLLLTVLVIGGALVVVGVAWQSLLPEVVPRAAVPSAAMVDGAVFNIARAVGPLTAGILLGLSGPFVLFGSVTALFAGAVLLLVLAGPGGDGHAPRTESIGAAVGGALRFVRHSPWTRGLLVRMVLFGLPASALWALVSLAVHDLMGLGAAGFGIAMGLLGVGAVTAALALGRVRARLPAHVFVALLASAYAVNLLALGLVRELWLLAPFLVLAGVGWVAVQSTWMMLAHQALPDWVRPRVIALVLMLFQGAQALGALLWGAVADAVGVDLALGIAAILLLGYAGWLALGGLSSSAGIEPVLATPDAAIPALVERAEEGELLVRYEYLVPPGQEAAFGAAMADLRLSRLRLGARAWRLDPDPDATGRQVESYRVRDRALLLEQETTRLTVPERRLRDAVRALSAQAIGPLLTSTGPDRSGGDA